MNIRPIQSDLGYRAALAEIGHLMDAKPGTSDRRRVTDLNAPPPPQ